VRYIKKGIKMTQEEYNNLSPEEQNALFATEVLGWVTNKYKIAWFAPGLIPVGMDRSDFDPNNNLDQAMMGAEPYDIVIIQRRDDWDVGLCAKNKDGELARAVHENLTQAIMLACLKAQGVVE